MAAAIGVSTLYSITLADSAEVNESDLSENIGKAEVRDADGVVVHHRAKKLITGNITLRGKGDPNFAAVAAGAFSEGTAKVVAAEGTEYNDGEYCDFMIEATRFSNWVAPE